MKISDMKTSDEVHAEDLANNPEYRKEWEGMSEDQAPAALEKPNLSVFYSDENIDWQRGIFAPYGDVEMEVRDTKDADPFGAKAVINAAYDLALASGTHPVQAIKAAYAAAMAHAESYEYINMSSKGSDVAEYRMVQRSEGKNKSV